MSRKSNWLIKNTAIFAVGNIMIKLVQFFLLPLYTIVLTTSEYAISELFNNTVEIVLPLFTLSITESVFRFSMDADSCKEDLIRNGLSVTIVGSFICALACIPIDIYFGNEYPIWLFVPLFISQAFRMLFAQYVRALEKVKVFAASGVLNSLALVGFALILLNYFKLGIAGYILSLTSANIVSIIFLLFFAELKSVFQNYRLNIPLMRDMIKYSAPLVPNTISWWLTNTSSRYIVIAICGASIGGLFSAASKIPALLNVCINTFQQAWVMSAIKEYDDNKDVKFQTEVYYKYSEFLFIVSSLIIILIPFLGKFLLQGDFYNGWEMVPLLIVSAGIGGIASFFGAFYSAAKRNMMSMISTLIGGLTNVFLCFLLTNIVGIKGALAASIFSYSLIAIIRIITTRKYAPLNVRWSVQILNILLLILESVSLVDFRGGLWDFVPYVLCIAILFINRSLFVDMIKVIRRFFSR